MFTSSLAQADGYFLPWSLWRWGSYKSFYWLWAMTLTFFALLHRFLMAFDIFGHFIFCFARSWNFFSPRCPWWTRCSISSLNSFGMCILVPRTMTPFGSSANNAQCSSYACSSVGISLRYLSHPSWMYRRIVWATESCSWASHTCSSWLSGCLL